MPARVVEVKLENHSSYDIFWKDDGRPHGDWQEPWFPSNLKRLRGKPFQDEGTFRLESDGICTGAEGWVYFAVRVDFPDPTIEYFTIAFDLPFWGTFQNGITWAPSDPGYPPHIRFEEAYPGGGYPGHTDGMKFTEFVMNFNPAMVYTSVMTFAMDWQGNHIIWWVRVLDASRESSRQGLVSGFDIEDSFTAVTYLNATQQRVWEALTRPELTVKYWHDMRIECPWTVGSKLGFYHRNSEHHIESGTLLEYAPPRRLAYTIKTDPCKDCKETRLSFAIDDLNDGRVKLTLRHDGLPTTRSTKYLHDAWRGIMASLKTMLESEKSILSRGA